MRLDKWLWAARFYKTRSLAAQAIDAGQARVDGERVKPAHAVRAGDRVERAQAGARRGASTSWRCPSGAGRRPMRRCSIAKRRKASRAREQAIAEQQAARAQAQPRFAGRPTKRDRRKLEDFLNEP